MQEKSGVTKQKHEAPAKSLITPEQHERAARVQRKYARAQEKSHQYKSYHESNVQY